jgi:hypothetical protein
METPWRIANLLLKLERHQRKMEALKMPHLAIMYWIKKGLAQLPHFSESDPVFSIT